MQRSSPWVIILWCLVVVWATSAVALTAVQQTFDDLVRRAELVLLGTVTSIQSALGADGERIYTYVTLAPIEVIKGEVPGDAYVLRVSGGVVGTRGESYVGMPQFVEGGRYLLF